MSDSVDVTEKLKTFLNDRYNLKTRIKNAVSNSYPLNLGTNFEKYGSEINKLYGNDICGVNAADAMYPWCYPGIANISVSSAGVNDTFIRPTQYAEWGEPDCPLHKLNSGLGGQISFYGVKELRIKDIDKFRFWFGKKVESLYFPDLEKIECNEENTTDPYFGTEATFPRGVFYCPIYAPKLKYLSKNFFNDYKGATPNMIFVDINSFFADDVEKNFDIRLGFKLSYVHDSNYWFGTYKHENKATQTIYNLVDLTSEYQKEDLSLSSILNTEDLSAFYPTLTNGLDIEYDIPANEKTSIGRAAFNGFCKLERVNIPSTITRIEDFGFATCLNLKEFTIPESVTYIGKKAFSSGMYTSLPSGFKSSDFIKNITFEGKTMAEVKAMENYPWGLYGGSGSGSTKIDGSTFICADGTFEYRK